MSATWWKVKFPTDPEFLILVTGGRIVTSTLVGGSLYGVEPGAMWRAVREKLEAVGFRCTMESSL